jgi:hypothetical protein
MKKSKGLLVALCLFSLAANALLGSLANGIFKISLYLDTVFTAALAFAFGFLPAFAVALLLPVQNYLNFLISRTEFVTDFVGYAFILCIVAEIILVCVFRRVIQEPESRFFARPSFDSFIPLAAPLLALAVLDCLAVSLSGGLIDFFIVRVFMSGHRRFPEDLFKLSFLKNNMPLLAASIAARIPINIVDRFIVVFGGYGVSLLYRRVAKSFT